MAQINPKITIRSVYFGMLLLSAAVMILTVRLAIASDLDSLKAAAEQGDATAQFNLGLMYDTGEGVPKNDAEAARWFRMAAEQGLAARLMEKRLNADPSGAKRRTVPCHCGNPAHYAGTRQKTFITALCEMHLSRAYYHCQSYKSGLYPAQDQGLDLSLHSAPRCPRPFIV